MLKQHADKDALDEMIQADPSVRDLMPTNFKDEYLGQTETITIFPENQTIAEAIKNYGGNSGDGLTIFVNEMLHTLDKDATKFWNEKQIDDAINEMIHSDPGGQ